MPSAATEAPQRPAEPDKGGQEDDDFFGPGLITGAADDDPSGIATYSQAGAQFRFGMAWTVLLTTPLMIAVQLISARIGYITHRGLAANIARICPRWLTVAVVVSLVVANTINIAADVSAMAEVSRLLAGGPQWAWVVAFGLLSAAAQVWLSYEKTVRALKYLTFVLFTYVAVVLMVHVPWARALREAATPWQGVNAGNAKAYAAMVVAMLGTTISPYLFFWQATQEVEDEKRKAKSRRGEADEACMQRHLRCIRRDTCIGMGLSNFIALCIVLAAAVTLNLQGDTDVHSSAEAAKALEPIAGKGALMLFGLGIVGTGLLAIPVLAGSAAYAVSEVFGWRAGLSRRFQDARGFYSIILAATGLGTALSLFQVDAMSALVWSAVINGVIAVPVMVMLMLIGGSSRLMGRFVVPRHTRVLGWVATAVMAAAAVAMFATMAL